MLTRRARRLFGTLRVAIAVALLLYLGASGAIDWSALRGLAAQWLVTLLAALLLLLDVVVTAWRVCVLLGPRGLHLSLPASIQLTLIGTFFNACLPGSAGGDMVRIYYAAAGNPGRQTEVATILLLDRAIGLFALLIWPLLAIPMFLGLLTSVATLRGLLWSAAAGAALAVAAGLVGSSQRVTSGRLVSWASRTLPLGRHAETVLDTLGAYRRAPGVLLAAVGISLLAHTIAVAVVLLVVRATNPAGFAWEMALLIPLGFLANALPLTPGGLGVGEAAFDKLFALAGLTGGAECLLGWRLLTILISLAGLVFYLQGRKRFVHASSLVGASR